MKNHSAFEISDLGNNIEMFGTTAKGLSVEKGPINTGT